MPIEPPDPLVTSDLLTIMNDPRISWGSGTIIKDKVPYYLHIKNATWVLDQGTAGAYLITQESFKTFLGARALDDGTYVAQSGDRYTLHPMSRNGSYWADAVSVPKTAA